MIILCFRLNDEPLFSRWRERLAIAILYRGDVNWRHSLALAHVDIMLDETQIEAYETNGYLSVESVLSD